MYVQFDDPKCGAVVAEIQLVIFNLYLVREKMGGHDVYGNDRFTAELAMKFGQQANRQPIAFSTLPWSRIGKVFHMEYKRQLQAENENLQKELDSAKQQIEVLSCSLQTANEANSQRTWEKIDENLEKFNDSISNFFPRQNGDKQPKLRRRSTYGHLGEYEGDCELEWIKDIANDDDLQQQSSGKFEYNMYNTYNTFHQSAIKVHPSRHREVLRQFHDVQQSLFKEIQGIEDEIAENDYEMEVQDKGADKKEETSGADKKEEEAGVEVTVRIRKKTAEEEKSREPGPRMQSEEMLELPEEASCRQKLWKFHRVYDGSHDQEEIFDNRVRPTLDRVLEGFPACFIAYGQTGSGKTYTMLGGQEPSRRGVIPRAFDYLYEHLPNSSRMRMAIIEFYQWKDSSGKTQEAKDLLNPSFNRVQNAGRVKICKFQSEAQRLAQSSGASLSNVSGVTVREITKQQNATDAGFEKKQFQNEVMDTIRKALERRIVKNTKMNSESSRGHLAVMVEIGSSLLFFLDLAGSEKVKQSGVTGVEFDEAIAINTSLYNLRNLVSDVAHKNRPTISHALCILLKPFILGGVGKDGKPRGGKGYLRLICALRPDAEHLSESLDTLRFADSAMALKNTPKKNEGLTLAQVLQMLRECEDQKKSLEEKLALKEEELQAAKKGLYIAAGSEDFALRRAISAYQALIEEDEEAFSTSQLEEEASDTALPVLPAPPLELS
eukprot:gnl/MRDRNA2_/MRDRNA2_28122_c0_seq1.p1 gnl/MRDRNA2_/MRDRNA2_28122_c0~~gnl/MRDRNA2_/MRDRNA2_28122_c0_seq1.p1  ORF type:complete len:720 (+),score=160.32 gnl/MRDRNA2_/MRDRNA2_28122_c0_seq1:1862-4021(+)